MVTLFYNSFQDTNNLVGTSINIQNDPLGQYQRVATFSAVTGRPGVFSSVISSNYKSFTVNFDYLGLPQTQQIALNLGCILSVADGGSLSDLTLAYAGAIKNSYPPIKFDTLEISPDRYSYPRDYNIIPAFIFLTDDSTWHHYSISFTTNSQNIRIALADLFYATPEGNIAGDCYFANLLVTDSYGPSPFIATSAPEIFRSISVDVLNQIANTVSYVNSNAAININLAINSASGGYAEGDSLNDIVNIVGSNFNDILLGSSSDNTLTGGDGDDVLTAGAGSDILIGGNGSDKFVITTEITKATIQDFNVNDDIIDLRLFSNLSSLQAIKSSSQYLSGNTVISLRNSKTLVLNGVNYNDLQESNFLIVTSSPTQLPTSIPSYIPTAIPTTPTFSPTTLSPTLQPTIYPSLNPTYSPSNDPTNLPTIAPTKSPTIEPTLAPSVSPTQSPTMNPTKFPTLIPFLTINYTNYLA